MKTVRLGNIANVDLSNVDKKTKEGEKSVKLCNFVDVYYNWAITNSLEPDLMIATANDNQIERFRIKKGQVAITKDSETRDDIGVSTYIADDISDCVLGYHCALITPIETELDGAYLNALFHTQYAIKYFGDKASGSGQRYTLTKEIIEDFPVVMPDTIDEQKNLARILANIDHKITLNDSICADLEAMAKQIYDYWFVQFDFPDEKGKPYKTNGGKMVYNDELNRSIPASWQSTTIETISKRVKVGFVGTVDKYYCDKTVGFPIVRPAEMSNEGINYQSLRHITVDFYEKNKKSQVHKGDIILSRCGKDGIPNKYDSDEPAQVLNAVIIEPDIEKASSDFLIEMLKSDYSQKQIEFGTSGSVQGVVNTSIIANIKLPYKKEIVQLFSERIESISLWMSNTKKENMQLLELRDFLLPMLMNGQIKIGG